MTVILHETWTGADEDPWPSGWVTDQSQSSGTHLAIIYEGWGLMEATAGSYRTEVRDDIDVQDVDVTVLLDPGQTSGAGVYAGLFLRWGSDEPVYIEIGAQSGSGGYISAHVGEGGTEIHRATGIQHPAWTPRWFRIQVVGSEVRVKYWDDGTAEPEVWLFDVDSERPARSGTIGLTIYSASGTRHTWWDELTVVDMDSGPSHISEIIIDDFARTLSLWPHSYGIVDIDNSRARLEYSGGYSGIVSDDNYDFADRAFTAEIELPSDPWPSSREFFFEVISDSANKVVYFLSGDGTSLVMRRTQGGVNAQESVPYDPVSMRWLRLRESGGDIYWDTSPDGEAWTQRYTLPHDIATSNVSASISAGDWAGGSVDVHAYIHHVGVPLPEGGEGFTPAVETLVSWSGQTWKVKEGVELGPHRNNFSRGSVALGDEGSIRLSIRKNDLDVWESAELIRTNGPAGYGTYRVTTASSVMPVDLHSVLGVFTFAEDYTEYPHHNEEIDIEYSRWGAPSHWPLSFSNHVRRTDAGGDGEHYTDYPFTDNRPLVHEIVWLPSYVKWTVSNVDGTVLFTREDEISPVYDSAQFRLNFWMMESSPGGTPHAPAGDEDLHVVFSGFSFTPSPPDPPGGLQVVGGTHQLTATWDPVQDADSYDLRWRRGGSSPGPWTVVADATSPHTVEELLPGEYDVAVRVTVDAEESGWSDSVSGEVPAPPAEWVDPTEFPGVVVASFEDDSVVFGERYRYSVRAVNAAGESELSDWEEIEVVAPTRTGMFVVRDDAESQAEGHRASRGVSAVSETSTGAAQGRRTSSGSYSPSAGDLAQVAAHRPSSGTVSGRSEDTASSPGFRDSLGTVSGGSEDVAAARGFRGAQGAYSDVYGEEGAAAVGSRPSVGAASAGVTEAVHWFGSYPGAARGVFFIISGERAEASGDRESTGSVEPDATAGVFAVGDAPGVPSSTGVFRVVDNVDASLRPARPSTGTAEGGDDTGVILRTSRISSGDVFLSDEAVADLQARRRSSGSAALSESAEVSALPRRPSQGIATLDDGTRVAWTGFASDVEESRGVFVVSDISATWVTAYRVSRGESFFGSRAEVTSVGARTSRGKAEPTDEIDVSWDGVRPQSSGVFAISVNDLATAEARRDSLGGFSAHEETYAEWAGVRPKRPAPDGVRIPLPPGKEPTAVPLAQERPPTKIPAP